MPSILRNILGVVIGPAACIFLNGLLLGFMMKLVGTPEGFDPNDLSTYHLLQGRALLLRDAAQGRA